MGKFYFSRDKQRERGNYPNFQKLFEKLKKRQRILQTALLLVVGLLASANASAYDFEKDGIYYNITSEDNRTVEVTHSGYTESYRGEVVIPTQVNYLDDTYTVASIGEQAFYKCSWLTSVAIPNSVETIGRLAFAYCLRLVSVKIGNGVTTIGSAAFLNCLSLTSIEIPSSVTTMEGMAFTFMYCNALVDITVADNNPSYTSEHGVLYSKDMSLLICHPAGKTETSFSIPGSVETIEEYAFAYCESLASIKFGDNVKTIKSDAFWRCESLASIEIPSSVTTIGYGAFSDCVSLTSIEIPSSVETIGDATFLRCSSLYSISVAKDNPNYVSKDGILYSKDMLNLVCYPAGKTETSFSIPNSVKNIESFALHSCVALTSIEIGSNVTTIGEFAFGSSLVGDGATIYCKAQTPPMLNFDVSVGESPFDSNTLYNAMLYVPIGTKSVYEATEGWKDFVNIKEMDFSGVASVGGETVSVVAEGGRIVVSGADGSEPMEVYTAAGQLVYRGAATTIDVAGRGIYIVRIAGSTYKPAL